MAWKRTYIYYHKEQADRVFRSLKKEGVKVKRTKRKLSVADRKRYGLNYVYTIYRWRIN